MEPERQLYPQPSEPSRTPVVTLSPDGTSEFPNASPDAAVMTMDQPDEPVHWQASEYIHHEKSPLWFILFGLVVLGFMALAIFLVKSITFAVLIPVMAAALIVYSHRPPRVLDYTLSVKGLYINDKLYPLTDYKGFGVIRDTGEYSVMLLPVKRFRPGVSVYFPERAGEAIVDMLGKRLPMQELHLDLIDRVVRWLRI